MTLTQHRLPFAPLEHAAGAETTADIARRLGISTQRVHDYRRTGIPVYKADRCAVRLGVHPLDVWPDFLAVPDLIDGSLHPSALVDA
jgi:hypothetical protein